MSEDTVSFDRDSVCEYLDGCIEYWRGSEEPFSEYYVDAYQSVRVSLFGERLP